MEQAKKVRAAFRRTFTRTANQLDELVTQERTDLQEIQVAWELLQLRADTLQSNDKVVFELLLGTDASEEELTNEITATDEYTSKLHKYRIICQNILHVNDESASVRNHNSVSGRASVSAVRKYKLPVIEFKKFGGDLRDWLPFWSQFKKINDDEDIALEDKFQYLIQATISGTRSRELVESFPPTGENYSKAVDSLRSRFGRDDLLVEVYVRELLKLVLNNTVMRDSKRGIAMLYDRIETQLRALETLGVTTDKCAAILYPLVESCLPEDLLRVWQRSSVFSANRDSILKSRLEELMAFLKAEVESEERILLAVEGFGPRLQESNIKKNKTVADSSIPTAAVLMTNQAAKCVFCDGVHGSEDCFKAQKMSLSAKRTRLAEKKACFFCLKIGHLSRKCKERLQCIICSRRHVVLMCPELPSHKGNAGEVNETADSESEERSVPVDKTLANHTDTRVFLQTLRVRIRNERSEREVRVVIDTGSQRSYILQSTAEEMGYISKRTENIVHALFGGTNSEEKAHSCYDIRLASLNGKYCCRFEVLDQPTICQNISSVYDGPWMAELKKLKIAVTDTLAADPIEVLIGADVAGKLLTGRRRILKCGLVTVQTLLGWVLMGKVPVERSETTTTMTVTSLLSQDTSVSDMWQSNVLGIPDPGEKILRTEVVGKLASNEGRYEVEMRCIGRTKALELKRVQSETKLRSSGASAKENEKPSLNQCLKNGSNVLKPEVITTCVELSTAQRLINPSGFTCPTLCPDFLRTRQKIGWDVKVDAESQRAFRKWFPELPLLKRIEIPRWIRGKVEERSCTDEWSIFAWNRTAEIRSLMSMEDVPRRMNPADLRCRRRDERQLLKSEWWEGPPWLHWSQEDFPRDQWHEDEWRPFRRKDASAVKCTKNKKMYLGSGRVIKVPQKNI